MNWWCIKGLAKKQNEVFFYRNFLRSLQVAYRKEVRAKRRGAGCLPHLDGDLFDLCSRLGPLPGPDHVDLSPDFATRVRALPDRQNWQIL